MSGEAATSYGCQPSCRDVIRAPQKGWPCGIGPTLSMMPSTPAYGVKERPKGVSDNTLF
ncbi:hypothetical protein PCO31110_03714 [Pandoraea communis]|uniref:Uncharacterized protein n=1 Tax=Pandoraea communis TaxID=2508297 RepID=A0A5E4X5J5_9BURK|nr:hypothetical protein PCO31110_03714 [Pandoraea communis]